MQKFTPIVLSSLALSAQAAVNLKHRELSENIIAGFTPETAVTDHNAIDLDQKVISNQVSDQNDGAFARAKAVYEDGGHSKSYAKLTFDDATAVIGSPDGTVVEGTDISGKQVAGKVYKSSSYGVGEVWVQYQTSSEQDSYVGCRVGGGSLVDTGDALLDGCFEESGSVTIQGVSYPYTYDAETDNHNGRTIQGFSTSARDKMITGCYGCPYTDASYFDSYYGTPEYGDKWVQAAFAGVNTNFPSGRGDANFGLYGFPGRAECVKKGTAYMTIFMYVIREFEDALDDCEKQCPVEGCNDDAVHAWDEGVAFYTGSLEGKDGEGSGQLIHALADKRCQNYGTCYNDEKNKSKVNRDLLALFKKGSGELIQRDCDAARKTTRNVIDLMYIPLIQGTMRYAYKVQKLQGGEKEKAEGAVFAASILPRIFAANNDDANTIYANMQVGASMTDFKEVKKAFERNYSKLNIKCEDVGGLLDDEDNYYPGMEPCKDKTNKTGIILGAVFGSLAVVGIAAFAFTKMRSGKSYDTSGNQNNAGDTV